MKREGTIHRLLRHKSLQAMRSLAQNKEKKIVFHLAKFVACLPVYMLNVKKKKKKITFKPGVQKNIR